MGKVLIIDDERQLRGLLARIIGLEGYEVIQAENCAAGLRQLERTRPEVVFADEPTGNLDTRTTKEVMHMIRGFAKRFHQTIVLVSHDPEMTEYADRIVTLIDGRIVSNVENQVKAEIDAAPYIE